MSVPPSDRAQPVVGVACLLKPVLTVRQFAVSTIGRAPSTSLATPPHPPTRPPTRPLMKTPTAA